MSATGHQVRTYFIKRPEQETGPFTIAQLNQMRARSEVNGSDLCRAAETADYVPLGKVFPHMADFTRKSPETHRHEARTLEGNWQANASLVCGIAAWFIAGPILGVFAVVLGVKAWLRVHRFQALIGILLGAFAFIVSALRIAKPFLQ